MILAIALTSLAAYLAGATWCARLRFHKTRPFREPVRCEYPLSHRDGSHASMCYRRTKDTTIDTVNEAAVFALIAGLIWPAFLLGAALLGIVTRDPHQLPEEVAAAVARMEKELGR